MARYLNFWKEKNIVNGKAYDTDDGWWICEYECMVVIETDKGFLEVLPVMFPDYLHDVTADEYLAECENNRVEVLNTNALNVERMITDWICNEGAVSGCSVEKAISSVISLLARYGLWKDEYAAGINMIEIEKRLV